MPLYTFRCSGCGDEFSEEMSFATHSTYTPPVHRVPGRHVTSLAHCGDYRQVLRFSFARGMQEHFNASVGKHISSQRDMTSELSRLSDETSERMGFDHKFEAVDPSDPAAVGVTEQGISDTERRAVEEGKMKVKRWM